MFRVYSWLILLLVAMAAFAPAQQSAERPNFTGTWNLDKQKSDFGGLEPPQSARYLIRHLGSKLELQYEHDNQTTRADVIPDGQERVLETQPDNENLARVYWSGSTLVFDGRVKPVASSHAPPVKWTSRWTLSPDKKELTIDRTMSTEQASAHQRVVFVKQPVQPKGQ